jgi:cytochrome c oxidase subunit IV
MTLQLWILVFLTPFLSYLICRFGVYGSLCGRAKYMARRKRKNDEER